MSQSDFAERAQIERRLAHYREMADLQIESILATMMTICTYNTCTAQEYNHLESELRTASKVSEEDSCRVTSTDPDEEYSSEALFLKVHQEHLE